MNFFENFNDIMFFIFLKKREFEICAEWYILKFFVNMSKFLLALFKMQVQFFIF